MVVALLKVTMPWQQHLVHEGHLECHVEQAYKQRQNLVSFLHSGKSGFGLDFEIDGDI